MVLETGTTYGCVTGAAAIQGFFCFFVRLFCELILFLNPEPSNRVPRATRLYLNQFLLYNYREQKKNNRKTKQYESQ